MDQNAATRRRHPGTICHSSRSAAGTSMGYQGIRFEMHKPVPRFGILLINRDKIMRRRTLLKAPFATTLFAAPKQDLPSYRVVSAYKPSAHPGMPGPYPGRVVSLHSARSIDEQTGQANPEVVREM